ncbi:GATA zinc finger domain-containing protein 14-like [Cardiocondyla obscurior]|uniref:GATA zinc finger domain-containing protein 14-like n=1 Tax=Cardiocondyla obscurior TaxID=286306 RepID=UPI0039656294
MWFNISKVSVKINMFILLLRNNHYIIQKKPKNKHTIKGETVIAAHKSRSILEEILNNLNKQTPMVHISSLSDSSLSTTGTTLNASMLITNADVEDNTCISSETSFSEVKSNFISTLSSNMNTYNKIKKSNNLHEISANTDINNDLLLFDKTKDVANDLMPNNDNNITFSTNDVVDINFNLSNKLDNLITSKNVNVDAEVGNSAHAKDLLQQQHSQKFTKENDIITNNNTNLNNIETDSNETSLNNISNTNNAISVSKFVPIAESTHVEKLYSHLVNDDSESNNDEFNTFEHNMDSNFHVSDCSVSSYIEENEDNESTTNLNAKIIQSSGNETVTNKLNMTSSLCKSKINICNDKDMYLARHLEFVLKNEEDVKKYSSLPKGIPERKQIIEILRQKGNFIYNTNSNLNKGDLIMCTENRENRQRNIKVLGRSVACRIHHTASTCLRRLVFPVMREDNLTQLIRYDELLIAYGNKMCLSA